MYSHGSSARVGVGKSGHGGRNYRPPPERNKDPSKLVPPPLKECDCMVRLDVPEYATRATATTAAATATSQPRRLHRCFEGSSLNERQRSVKNIETELRSKFGVHLHIPGRNQQGPLAVVGKSYKEAIPAVAYLMTKLILDGTGANNNSSSGNDDSASESLFLTGQILRNVKDPNDVVLSGRLFQHRPTLDDSSQDDAIKLEPYWLFDSDHWKIMVCPLVATTQSSQQPEVQQHRQAAIADALKTSIDNLRFRLGTAALSELDIFLYKPPEPIADISPSAFAGGDPSTRSSGTTTISALYQEILSIRVAIPDATKS